jgi:hypothetical protein
VLLSVVPRIPMSSKEQSGVGFMENGRFKIPHW